MSTAPWETWAGLRLTPADGQRGWLDLDLLAGATSRYTADEFTYDDQETPNAAVRLAGRGGLRTRGGNAVGPAWILDL